MAMTYSTTTITVDPDSPANEVVLSDLAGVTVANIRSVTVQPRTKAGEVTGYDIIVVSGT